MQGGKFGRSQRHGREQRLSYSYQSSYAVNSFLNDQIVTLAFNLFIMLSSG